MSTEAGAAFRQRISDALLEASSSDWDAGEGRVIELPLSAAADAVMAALEDAEDAALVAASMDEPGEDVPWEQVKAEVEEDR